MTDANELNQVFRSRILDEIEELRGLQGLSKTDRAPVELDQQSVGRVSRIDSLQMQAMANAAESRRIQRIRVLEAALKRMEQGEYGYCTACGEEINIKRLEVDLAATRCISCAS
jgi:DnaK suppressor protein